MRMVNAFSLMSLAVGLTIPVLAASPAQAGFEVCNKALFAIQAGVAHEAAGDAVFSGWRALQPDECQTVIQDLEMRSVVYLYAFSDRFADGSRRTWREGAAAGVPPSVPTAEGPFNPDDWTDFIAVDVGQSRDYTYNLACSPSCVEDVLRRYVDGIAAMPLERRWYDEGLAMAETGGALGLHGEIDRLSTARDSVVSSWEAAWRDLDADYDRNIKDTKDAEGVRLYGAHLKQRIAVSRTAVSAALAENHTPLALHFQEKVDHDLWALEDLAPEDGAKARAESDVSAASLETALKAWHEQILAAIEIGGGADETANGETAGEQ